VSGTLIKGLRQGDNGYRFGGEEFLLILEATPLRSACQLAERYRSAVENLNIPHTASVKRIVTVSLGVALWRQGDETLNTWLKAADAALYQAKSLGRNRVYPEVE
jgi:diguanylate cyclase (GGDEF)-like protein